jgi:translation initiation factor IF-1
LKTDQRRHATENVKGIVEAALAQGLYRVKCEDGRIVNASLSGVPKQTIVRVIPGDRVLLRVSDLDPTRGKIQERLK